MSISACIYHPDPAKSDTENQQYWNELQAIAKQSRHNIKHDQPDLVIDTILEMVDVLRQLRE